MAGTADLWDLSGQSQARNSLPSGTKSSSGGTLSSGTSSSSESQTTSSIQSTAAVNMPSGALADLQALLDQMIGGKPLVDPALLDKEAPLLKQTWLSSSEGWGYVDPTTGARYAGINNPDALRIQAQREAKRTALTNAAGFTLGMLNVSQGERNKQITDLQSKLSGYSKDQAFADASLLTGKFTRQLMEQLMPAINRAAESSGTSGGAVRGLLVQDAAARVAENQAALGLDTAVKYGQISTGLDSLINDLIKTQDPNLQAVIQLLNVAKGSIEQRVSAGTQSTSGNKSVTSTEDKTSTEDTTIQGTGNTPYGVAATGTKSAVGGVPVANQSGGYPVVPLNQEQIKNLTNSTTKGDTSSVTEMLDGLGF